jgi:amino acid transporter
VNATVAQLKNVLYPGLIVVFVLVAWSGGWHAGLGKSDFAGHVGLMTTFADQFVERPGLHLWTSDWNSGSSLVFWYLHPLISSFLLLPFAQVWGAVDGLRIGDTFFVAVAGIAMYRWCRHLTGSEAAAFVGALVYALHPSVFVFVGEVGQVHQPISMAIVPLLFLAWTRLAEAPCPSTAVIAAVASALLFLDMERFWLILPHALVIYGVVVWRNAHQEKRAAELRRALVLAVAVGVGMTLLVAFPALPGLFERPLLQWHDTQSIDVFRQYYSFPHLFALFDRDGVLAAQMGSGGGQSIVSLPGQWYQGVVAMLLVAAGGVMVARRSSDSGSRNRLTVVLFLFVVALLVAFGVHAIAPKHGALIAGVFERSVGWRLVATLLMAGALVVLFFGSAFHLFYRSMLPMAQASGEVPANRRVRALALVGVGLAIFLFAKPFVLLADTVFVYAHLRAPGHFAFPALPFLLATAVSLVMPAWLRAVGERRQAALVVAVTALILLDVSPYRFQQDWTYPDERVAGWTEAFATLEQASPGRMLDTHHYNPVADTLAVGTAQRDLAWGWLSWSSTRFIGDIIKTGFFDTMRIARARPDVREANTRLAAELSGLANVRYVSQLAGVSPLMPAADEFELIEENEHAAVYRNRLALPYVQFYPELALLMGSVNETVPLVGALAQEGIASLTLDAGRGDESPDSSLHVDYWRGDAAKDFAGTTAIELPARPPFRETPTAATRPANRAPCKIVARAADVIHLECDFERAGTLVIAEAWFPGWEVELNGVRRSSLRLNHAFQGVAVEAGPAEIRFLLVPNRITLLAWAVSSVAWVACLVIWIRDRRGSPRSDRSDGVGSMP